MSLAGVKEYRLVHKKNGEYVLQVKEVLTIVDYDKGTTKTKVVWKDTETIER